MMPDSRKLLPLENEPTFFTAQTPTYTNSPESLSGLSSNGSSASSRINISSSSSNISSRSFNNCKLSPPFDSSLALTIIVLVTALFFMGFFSTYIRRFADDSSIDLTRRRRRGYPAQSLLITLRGHDSGKSGRNRPRSSGGAIGIRIRPRVERGSMNCIEIAEMPVEMVEKLKGKKVVLSCRRVEIGDLQKLVICRRLSSYPIVHEAQDGENGILLDGLDLLEDIERVTTDEVWKVVKYLGVTYEGTDVELVNQIANMEAKDRDGS
ncbi:hypothetical protein Ancab_004098 [Ancistrocladus abbreviatus]